MTDIGLIGKLNGMLTCLNGGLTWMPCPAAAAGLRLRLFHNAAQLLRQRALPEQAPGSANHGASCRARLMPCNIIADQSRASKPLKKQRECHHAAQRCRCPPNALHISRAAATACWHSRRARQGIPLARWWRTRPPPTRAGCYRLLQAAAPASPPLQPPVCGTHITSQPTSRSWLQWPDVARVNTYHHTDHCLHTEPTCSAAAMPLLAASRPLMTASPASSNFRHSVNVSWSSTHKWHCDMRSRISGIRTAWLPVFQDGKTELCFGKPGWKIMAKHRAPEAGLGRPAGAAAQPAAGPGCAAARCRPAALQQADHEKPQTCPSGAWHDTQATASPDCSCTPGSRAVRHRLRDRNSSAWPLFRVVQSKG